MARKRSAANELNDANWNCEQVPEEAGIFAKAPEDILQKRIIKAAKRRLPSNKDELSKNVFNAFDGFKTSASASSPFSFLTNAKSDTSSSTNTNAVSNTSTTSNGSSKIPENGRNEVEESSSKSETLSKEDEVKSNAVKRDVKRSKKSSDYYAALKGLNESVTQWIKTHVDSNPFCILTPIFRDYEKYLSDIESKRGCDKIETINAQEKSQQAFGVKSTASESAGHIAKKSSIFENVKSSLGESSWKPEKSIFGNTCTSKSIFGNMHQKVDDKNPFGSINIEENPFLSKSSSGSGEKKDEIAHKDDAKLPASGSFLQSGVGAATFSFGRSSTTSTASAGFSFGSAKPFSFGSQVVKSQDHEEKVQDDKDEDEEPPKTEYKPVTEEGAIYEQRCKVFIKKDGNFSDRGVGTLFLKPTPNGKTQLIVRANTSLANLLINTLLTESIPIQRMSKNTIMTVCLPLPDSQPPPTAVLLRVKTTEDADTLFETLNKYKANNTVDID